MRFLAFFLPTAPSVFFHRSCDKTSAVCWLGGRTSQMCRNRCDKCPHFAEKPAGHGKHVEKILWHHKCPKIMWQNVHTSLKSRLDVANVLGKNPMTNRPHVAKQLAGCHKWVQKFCDKPSKFCFRKGWTWCHKAFWEGGCYVTSDKLSTLKWGWTKNT
jgi:hypothetical protein